MSFIPPWAGGPGSKQKQNPFSPRTSGATTTADSAERRATNTQNVTNGMPSSFTPGVSGGGLMRDGQSISGQTATAPVTGNPPGAPVYDPGPMDAFGSPVKSDEEYLKADSVFQAQKNALQAALDAYLADTEAQKQTYNTNYGESLRKLGFTGDQGALDKAKWDATENNGQGRWEDTEGNPFAGKIDWNQTDTNTASGRGFENALNDFAARGMLQSSAYQRAYNNLQRQLSEQLSSTAGAKQTAMGEFDRAQAAKKSEKTTSEATASQEALARIKAAYGIG